ncbi:SRPBCC family protein [Chitinophaga sp. 22620]|uniref:SRPBCC family protein n=1 Tax=Chitinophaga sp. 22620 TaxID=3453952 RepID=UPI003F860E7C
MPNRIIEKTIDINATPANVWRVFTDPAVTRQMGGEYVSGWKPGSEFGWKGKDGTMLTRGIILELAPAKLLKHNLSGPGDPGALLSTITYEFIENGGGTMLSATEELHYETTEEQFSEAAEGWDYALQAVKDIAEKL